MVSGEEIVPLLKNEVGLKGIEIGVGEGINSHYLLSNLSHLHLYTVDPFINYKDWNGNDLDQNRAFLITMGRLSEFKDRWTHYRESSDQAVYNFNNEEYDFIFIDGLHTYDQVLNDCKNYWSKIKKGGLFCGHDYKVISEVRQAIDTFANEKSYNVNYLYKNDVWWWIKN